MLANEQEFRKHGSKLIEVVMQSIHNNQGLEEQFKLQFDGSSPESVHSVYLEFTRKLCNTRIQEFIDVYRQRAAKDDGLATIAGQNLRDTLLTYHVNPKTSSA